jgi:hypothetical protein
MFMAFLSHALHHHNMGATPGQVKMGFVMGGKKVLGCSLS